MLSVFLGVVTPAPHLVEGAAYGKLPFDRFVLDHWVYSRPVDEDQKQWDELAKRWLLMDHMARSPHWEAAYSLANTPADDSRMPTKEQVNRVLAPHQSILERNLALLTNDCLWLRTCYESSHASAYAEMTRVILMDAHDAHRVLDNESLYGNLCSDLTKLFLRMPQLSDTVAYCGIPKTEDLPLDSEPLEDESLVSLHNAMMKEKLVIYVLDKEALQKKMLKVCWFDLRGNIVWWNWISTLDTVAFEGHLNGLGHRLGYLLELSDGDPSLREEGAIIQFD